MADRRFGFRTRALHAGGLLLDATGAGDQAIPDDAIGGIIRGLRSGRAVDRGEVLDLVVFI